MSTAHDPLEPPYTEVTLLRKDAEARVAIAQRELEWCRSRGHAETFLDSARGQLVLSLRAFVFAKEHPEKTLIRYPETWWDAVKERFGPAWFLARYPVRFVEVSTALEELYPDVEPSIPDQWVVMKVRVNRRVKSQFPI